KSFFDKSNSSLANNSLLNPPIWRNAAVSQKINEPATYLPVRLMKFHKRVTQPAKKCETSSLTVEPPKRYLPDSMASATAFNKSALGCESASTKISQSPVAASAPL